MKKLFADKEFYNKLVRLTLPIAFQSLMLAAVAAADAVMLGRIEQNQMAAVSLATQVQFIQNMVLSAATAAGSILGAQYYGKQDTDTINKIFAMMMRCVGIVSIVFAGACLLVPELLMMIFAHDPELIRIGASYLRIAGWSYLLTGISECYLTIMKITDHVKRGALISSGTVVINIILNSIFIFGLFGIPAMGANGAALATLLSRIIEVIWAVSSSYQKGFLRPRFGYLLKSFPGLRTDFIKVSLPLLGGGLFWGVGFTSYTAIMGHLGSDAAAANSVAAVVRDLFCCMCNGISSAGGIMVGNELGAGKLQKGKQYGIRLAKISYVIGFLCTALVLAVTVPVVNFMKLTDIARSHLMGMMVVMAIYMIGRCVNTIIINGIFGAGGDTLFDVYSLAVCMWCLAIPTALLGAFVFHWPVVAVYACTCLDEVGKIPWVMYHFQKYKWVKDLTREVV
ncbi:MATE family efflux transporter [Butyrivibrio sp. WCD2001]|uniref:MATE family efflux transporter n=1 Tax=Butyrivibrio sp. WCD2001 TaxID=1280681 RepID=UPI000420E5A9|nr:MATE family efflux transporter [Butyrivibrio sp. WCD2001]